MYKVLINYMDYYYYYGIIKNKVARKLEMRCMNSYALNKNVFSLFLNGVSVMSGARSAAGRLFHTRGPWTAKLRSP